ncbi:MAG: putative toxin-antitoxin system toxin component, PIN family [Sphingomonadales bacterium]|nr:putative toxin-antitoxin system toxin component, PIN family [Sphingomonadales bacterium]
MRVVIDTNIWISSLINPNSNSGILIQRAKKGKFELVVSESQFAEFRRVSRYVKLKSRFLPAEAGRLTKAFRKVGIAADPLPRVDRSPDPDDNFLLAMAEASQADFLISGDKRHIISLESHGDCRILTLTQFIEEMSG